MKTIEEKAKRYDEAIERMKHYVVDEYGCSRIKVAYVFPELKETEDEKMWKLIKKYAHYNISDMALDADHITRGQLESWLEKQEGKKLTLKSSNSDDVWRLMKQIMKEAEAYELNLPNRDYDIYAFAKDILAWLEKMGEQNYKIIKGKNYFCVKTHNYAGVEWIKDTKYYASDDYTLVNQGCEYYCPEYSKEEHNNLFEEVKCDGCVEKQGEQKPVDKVEAKFHEGDKLISTINPNLTYDVLEVRHINVLGNPEYKVRIFDKGIEAEPGRAYYMDSKTVDEWAKLIEQKSFDYENADITQKDFAPKIEPKFIKEIG